jgi:hypothetical protein
MKPRVPIFDECDELRDSEIKFFVEDEDTCPPTEKSANSETRRQSETHDFKALHELIQRRGLDWVKQNA